MNPFIAKLLICCVKSCLAYISKITHRHTEHAVPMRFYVGFNIDYLVSFFNVLLPFNLQACSSDDISKSKFLYKNWFHFEPSRTLHDCLQKKKFLAAQCRQRSSSHSSHKPSLRKPRIYKGFRCVSEVRPTNQTWISVKPALLNTCPISSTDPISGPVLTAGISKSWKTENRRGFRIEYGSCIQVLYLIGLDTGCSWHAMSMIVAGNAI